MLHQRKRGSNNLPPTVRIKKMKKKIKKKPFKKNKTLTKKSKAKGNPNLNINILGGYTGMRKQDKQWCDGNATIYIQKYGKTCDSEDRKKSRKSKYPKLMHFETGYNATGGKINVTIYRPLKVCPCVPPTLRKYNMLICVNTIY